MDAAALLFIATWLIFLWIVGWLALPLARLVFVNLPDGGLAAGRTLTLTLVSLLLFWGASLRLLPLTTAPIFVVALPILACVLGLRRPVDRAAFAAWVRAHRRALIVSDAVFVVIFGFFLWIRLRHPEINDLEKPMDAALIAALLRSRFLPAENPWFSGTAFTNYYYFGHFMGSLLARTLATPLPFAYNLVLPAFSALFVAPLWSLCTALTGSLRRGLVAASMVALLGHFEPLRQWAGPAANPSNLFHLDAWSTSRVVPDTINEYPIFTLGIGDAHAHFYALALAALYFCLCFELFGADAPMAETPHLAWLTRRHLVLILIGLALGLFWVTNTWDLPIYGVLAMFCALWTLPLGRDSAAPTPKPEPVAPTGRKKRKAAPVSAPVPVAAQPPPNLAAELLWTLLPLVLARLAAWPYLRLFQPQVSGAVPEIWPYPTLEFLLFWGGFLTLWFIAIAAWWPASRRILAGLYTVLLAALALPITRAYFALVLVPLALLLTATVTWGARRRPPSPDSATTGFVTLLAIAGLLALLAPMLFYMKGAFGDGSLRHQDTVFKFFIEAWLLLGTAAACGAVTLWASLARLRKALAWPLAAFWALLWSVPVACAVSVIWNRTVLYAPRDANQNFILSLDGARHISPDDRAAMEWLRTHARPGDAVLEAVETTPGGGVGGDYKAEYGRVAALTGVPDPVAWPTSHIMPWGAPWGDITQRADAIKRAYAWTDNGSGLDALHQLHVRYVFVGDTERNVYDQTALTRLRDALPIAFSSGNTFVAAVP